MLQDGTKFDSSYDRGTPIDFNVGTGQVIKGWDLGLVGMKVGGKRRLVIAPDYAYGAAGPVAFDCSGLVLWIVEQLGLTGWEHGSQWQFYNSLAPRVKGAPQPGDFVFIDYEPSNPQQPEHVGICIGGKQMIDAPETGELVRIDTFTFTPGVYYGATRPATLLPNPQPEVEMFIFEDPSSQGQYFVSGAGVIHLNLQDYKTMLATPSVTNFGATLSAQLVAALVAKA